MTIAISESDYTQLWQRNRQQRSITYGRLANECEGQSETIDVCPQEFGRGYERWIDLPEIKLLIIDRIHQVSKILIDLVQHPPSLTELSRQVGLNDRKLKQGFHQVFGTTVFGYLHEYRMVTAMKSLSQGNTNVDRVIRSVGYASRSSFSKAFKQRFGASPRNYLI